jgi:hypothetical protein
MKPTVAACAHVLVVAQWRLVDAELDADVELDATKCCGGHPWSIDLSSGRNKVDGLWQRREARDARHGGAQHEAQGQAVRSCSDERTP